MWWDMLPKWGSFSCCSKIVIKMGMGVPYAKDHVVAHYAVDFDAFVWLDAYSGYAHAEIVAGICTMLQRLLSVD